ncbi:MAG: shikimate kinase [Acidobacteriota bacterium]
MFTGNLYIIGFMGSGKTTVGRLLAERLGRRFIDTDAVIEEGSGMRVAEIFERKGEGQFRRLERKCVESVSMLKECVVSLGGGAVLDDENWQRIAATGSTVYLSYPPEILRARLQTTHDRPLLARDDGRARIAELLAVREPLYRRADLVLQFSDEVSPERVVELLIGHIAGACPGAAGPQAQSGTCTARNGP